MRLFKLLPLILLMSCNNDIKSPTYDVVEVDLVPDSLKEKQRTWVTETIRAASQHMTGGDYEDVDETIEEVTYQSENLFSVKCLVLRKTFYVTKGNYYNHIDILPDKMSATELEIFKGLTK